MPVGRTFPLASLSSTRQNDAVVIPSAAFTCRELQVRGAPMKEMLIQLDVDAADRRWQERANCLGVDPDLFFPERGASTKEAKSVCGGCEVRMECLEYALRHGEKFGIWGGMSERERRRIRPQRALARRGLASA